MSSRQTQGSEVYGELLRTGHLPRARPAFSEITVGSGPYLRGSIEICARGKMSTILFGAEGVREVEPVIG
jgi:hypothetical protein